VSADSPTNGNALRETEVEDLDPAVLGHHHVRGLDVPMDDAMGVGDIEGIDDLADDVENFSRVELALLQRVWRGFGRERIPSR
jgi:hypothetical protein